MNTTKLKAIGLTYFRAAAASCIALYLAGQTDLKVLSSAFIAGLAGPILKALDPSASEFGKNAE